ncbi:MAG: 16S rRNA (cytosine(1402)-N(4))-methyltransferase RsmH [Solirubrobacterales bacterium]|nr:16S rRNA (cytosine(1402)-N(4))-methyltransferase RsmH [Solirubrobacterales bacterium]
MSAAARIDRDHESRTPAPGTHIPVLATDLVDLVSPKPGETVIDCTFGAGGHARLAAARIGPEGLYIGIDRDPVARARFHEFESERICRTRFIPSEFSLALAELFAEGIRADVIYMDLGMSSLQVDASERGFSYAHEAPLDMRMDPRQELTAGQILNQWPEDRIARILRELGEERYAGGIAREITARRPLESTADLVEAVRAGVPAAARFGAGHPARRTFQALRIAVNGELEAVDAALPLAWDTLVIGGRMAAISFHSLEDRRVKRFFADLAVGCKCPPDLPVCICGHQPEATILTRRAITPDDAELAVNPRSRSARLRGALKLAEREEEG